MSRDIQLASLFPNVDVSLPAMDRLPHLPARIRAGVPLVDRGSRGSKRFCPLTSCEKQDSFSAMRSGTVSPMSVCFSPAIFQCQQSSLPLVDEQCPRMRSRTRDPMGCSVLCACQSPCVKFIFTSVWEYTPYGESHACEGAVGWLNSFKTNPVRCRTCSRFSDESARFGFSLG